MAVLAVLRAGGGALRWAGILGLTLGLHAAIFCLRLETRAGPAGTAGPPPQVVIAHLSDPQAAPWPETIRPRPVPCIAGREIEVPAVRQARAGVGVSASLEISSVVVQPFPGCASRAPAIVPCQGSSTGGLGAGGPVRGGDPGPGRGGGPGLAADPADTPFGVTEADGAAGFSAGGGLFAAAACGHGGGGGGLGDGWGSGGEGAGGPGGGPGSGPGGSGAGGTGTGGGHGASGGDLRLPGKPVYPMACRRGECHGGSPCEGAGRWRVTAPAAGASPSQVEMLQSAGCGRLDESVRSYLLQTPFPKAGVFVLRYRFRLEDPP